MSDMIGLERGSTLVLAGSYAINGVAQNMTGYSLALYEADAAMASATIAWVNQTTGTFQVTAAWDETWQAGKTFAFRVKFTKNATSITTGLLQVLVK